MKKETYDIIVLGGGPAGMMAAARAGELGARVLLIEKNDRLGKKLSLTGGQRCNITNAQFDNRLFLENFKESKQFLFSPLSQFNVESTFEYFESRGLPLVVEDRKRAFPKSQKVSNVCDVLKKDIAQSGNVTVKLKVAMKSFVLSGGRVEGVKTSSGTYFAKRFILATGGYAAPETGSTSEGLSMLAKLGHTVKSSDPNLVPLKTNAKWVHRLSGTSIDDLQMRFIQDNRTKLKVRGRLLFTHFGISGPMVINASHKVKTFLKKGKVEVSLDLFPEYDIKRLDEFFTELFDEGRKKLVKNILASVVQKKVGDAVLHLNKLDIGEIPAHEVTKVQRKALVHALKDLRFPITGTMGLDWSIVADGGVDPKEVDFKTMASRMHKNVYLVGDTLNINRPSGGFSLQLCWTTGHVAGTHAARFL